MNKKILVVHPTGNQNSKAVTRGLARAGMLHSFITAVNIKSDRFKWFPNKLYSELKRRDFSEIEGKIVSGAGFREGLRLLANKLKLGFLTKHEVGFSSVDAVYHATDRAAAKYLKKHAKEIAAVYCYEDGALETFKIAKPHRIKCIYELPAGYWKKRQEINNQEHISQPEWASSWKASIDSKRKLDRKDEELSLADHVFVASSFSARTLSDYEGAHASVTVIPYGAPIPALIGEKKYQHLNDKLKVLSVGGLSQGKGWSYLVSAIKEIGNKIDFTYIGNGQALPLIRDLLPKAKYLGTMPHALVLEQMRQHDVLVFPSLFEGFGMVITEAMSQGMVVIATDHTALADIADETSSILIPIRDPEAIKMALQDLIDHPEKVQNLGQAAIRKAQAYQWKDYENRLVEVIQKL